MGDIFGGIQTATISIDREYETRFSLQPKHHNASILRMIDNPMTK